MATGMDTAGLLSTIRDECLGAYRSQPKRLEGDVGNESENQSNYHRRFIYELLQNADDVFANEDLHKARFELHNDRLILAHSGAPFSEENVRALCILGVSSKSDQHATIGQKGRGFTSVLEITDQPRIYSSTHDFGFDRERAYETITSELAVDSSLRPSDVPVLTLPYPPEHRPARVRELLAENSPYTTAFEFELRSGRYDSIKSRLEAIDPHLMLFLRRLERLEIAIGDNEVVWEVNRQPLRAESTDDLDIKKVDITRHGSGKPDDAPEQYHRFIRFRKTEIPVTAREGIEGPNWSDVEYTEIGAACRYEQRDGSLRLLPFEDHPTIHLFLPTEEPSPFPLLLNGAFKPDSSRRKIPIVDVEEGYNAFLLDELATLIAEDFLDFAGTTNTRVDEFLSCIHIDGQSLASDSSEYLAEAVVRELHDEQFLPVAGAGLECRRGEDRYAPSELVLPFSHPDARWLGQEIVDICGSTSLPAKIDPQERRFPATALLTDADYQTLEFLGLDRLEAFEIPPVMAGADPERAKRRDYDEVGIRRKVDPVLHVLIGIDGAITDEDINNEFVTACRTTEVFPVAVNDDGIIDRTQTEDANLLFPPEEFDSRLQLTGVKFLAPGVYRPPGWIRPRGEHGETDDFQAQLAAIWEIEPFDFQSFAQAVIFPRLPRSQRRIGRIEELQSFSELRIIRELAGESVKPSDSLPHEPRKPTELYRLCMLPVPTQDHGWMPAYRVYFGEDWFEDFPHYASPLPIFEACDGVDVPTVVPPNQLVVESTLRERMAAEESSPEEAFVSLREEWFDFFRWLGVTPHIRLTPLFYPEHEREYSKTANLGRPSKDHPTLGALSESTWSRFRAQLEDAVNDSAASDRDHLSIYRASRLENWTQISDAALSNAAVGILLFCHLAFWWGERFRQETTVGVGGHSVRASSVSSRNRGIPNSTEQYDLGTNLWLWELKQASWCPSIHGQFEPGRVWQRTESLIDQFTIGERTVLLPVLHRDIERNLGGSAPDALCRALGIRATMATAEFEPTDARLICDLLAQDAEEASNEYIEQNLPTFRTAYRELASVMPSRQAMQPPKSWRSSADELADTPVICELEGGTFELRKAKDAYFVTSRGERRQIPLSDPPVFILKETVAGAYGSYFEMQQLIEAVETDFDRDGAVVQEQLTQEVRSFVEDHEDALRCLLMRDRPAQQETDGETLRRFIEDISLVEHLEVTYRLGELEEPSVAKWFIESPSQPGGRRIPYLVAPESGQVRHAVESLAKTLCEFLDYRNIGDVVLILQSDSDQERNQKLELLDAPRDLLDDIQQPGSDLQLGTVDPMRSGDGPAPVDGQEAPAFSMTNDTESGVSESATTANRNPEERVWDPGELAFTLEDGTVLKGRELDVPLDRNNSRGNGGGGSSGRAEASPSVGGIRDVVGEVGEKLAYQFECARLADYHGIDDPDSYVFRVSDRSDIERARKDLRAQPILRKLTNEIGLDRTYPGFDILTVDPDSDNSNPAIDRLIEVKSTMSDGPVKMSLNEWSTAQRAELQSDYFLYVVTDLDIESDGRPFIRTIESPAEILLAQPQQQESISIEVDPRYFRQGGTVEEIPMREDR